jgi:predicted nucleic acid-binding protein
LRSAANKLAVYFFDTSALAKRYVAETGSAWVRQISHPTTGNKIYIVSITGVEVISALMKRVREASLTLNDAQSAIADFRNDFDKQYIRLDVTGSLIQRAMGLPEKHKLRAYDAVQLAAALAISAQSLQQGIPATGVPSLVVVASDQELLLPALAEAS